MTDLYLDPSTGDLEIVNGDLVVITNKEDAALQSVRMILNAYKGEWFRNILFGVPWIENDNNTVSIVGKTHKTVFDSYIRGAILKADYINSIISYESTLDPYSGELTLNAEAGTDQGIITISETVQL
jgi:hypothetical protein